ncbi:MAG TPA: amidophosphoribosyltransferase [Alphaproteobacteria bacterium]|nr:amidophosphoribosyltransferase [Alphaproteobacteria bacterium]
MADDFGEKCGLFGVYQHPEAAKLTYLGLYALQHRGQESAGIVSSDGQTLHAEVGMGLVADVFNERRLARLPGSMAIGHNRYSTTGSSLLRNAQPIVISYAGGSLALAHNGNLVNAAEIRKELEQQGAIFRSTTDTEVIVHLIARSTESRFADQVVDALRHVRGAYSLLLMTEQEMIGVRDPFGFRPLVLGQLDGSSYILASETCALDLIGAEYVRDVAPGEMVVIHDDEVEFFHPFPQLRQAFCIFEFIYFARPDSIVFEKNVYPIRKALGRQLAREAPVEADVVIPVPDSGVPAALGYAEEAGIPFEMGLIRNHYVGRTFIEPQQAIRHFGAKVKLNPVKHFLRGKRVVVVDDSIVRGTTGQKIVTMLKNAGAKEVHMRISSPPSISPCFYGIDTPSKRELIAANQSVEEIRDFLGADSLAYLSLKGLLQTVAPDGHRFCTACFTGDYPERPPTEELLQLELF